METAEVPHEAAETQLPTTNGVRKLNPDVRTIWTIKYMLFFGVLLIGALFYETVQLLAGGGSLPFGTISGTIFLLGGLYSVFMPKLRYRYWRFALRSEELYLQRGIFNRVRTIVPLRRIQHLDVSQDLIEREFDLGKLIVHTAGSRSSNVVLPGLRYEEAEQLRDDVKRYVLEDAL